MLDLDIDQLDDAVKTLSKTLKDGLLATDIWDHSTGLSLAGLNSQAEATALFNLLTDEIAATLDSSGYSELGDYYILDLDANHMVVIVLYGEGLMQGILMASDKVNLGVLFAVALPKLMRSVRGVLTAVPA